MRDTPVRRASRLMFRAMSYRSPDVPVPAQGGMLTGVTIVKPGQGRKAGQTMVWDGNRITRIASVENGDGKDSSGYVLPGLIDMHVHIPPMERDLASLLFLAHGVTTVREAGDADGSTWAGRERIRGGAAPGPRIFLAGPVLDGDPPFLFTSWRVRNAPEGRAAVATLAARGVDFIKIHHKLTADALAGIRAEAAERGLRVAGHIPMSVPFDEARIWDVQHLDGAVPYPQPPATTVDYQRGWRDLDPGTVDAYVRTSVEQELVHTPTLASYHALLRLADPEAPNDAAVRLLPRYYRDVIWNPRGGLPILRNFTPEALALARQAQVRVDEMVRRLHAAGVRIHAGTDTAGMPFLVCGASLQLELGYLVDAGLSLEDAWIAGTRAAGESLGVPLLGVLQPGAPADLLLFGEDPTRDLAALATLRAVVADGRLYTREALDAALALHRERFEQPWFAAASGVLLRLAMKAMGGR